MIKFWAFIYRLTGWYSPFARLAEYKHIKGNMLYYEVLCKHPTNNMPLKKIIKLEIGLWQAENNFIRKKEWENT